jgi:NitT/TauT family transport system ATP-binding protein
MSRTLTQTNSLSTSSEPAARTTDAGYQYPHGGVEALRGITLEIGSAEIVAVVGPSGCGKTTLVRLLSGLLAPTTGIVSVEGDAPSISAAKGRIGLLFQGPVLLPWRDLLGNVSLPNEFLHVAHSSSSPLEALRAVGLDKFAHHFPHQLSGGMQQRAALARAMVSAPHLLLLDEPFSSLDELSRWDMLELLLGIQRKAGFAALLVTHSLREAVLVSDRVIVFSGSPGTTKHIEQILLPKQRDRNLLDSETLRNHVRCLRSHILSAR